MKKLLVLTLIALLCSPCVTFARTKYDSTGRKIIYDGTIRGQKRAAEAQAERQRKLEAAAAARMNYEEALKSLEEPKPKTNFYQDRIKQ